MAECTIECYQVQNILPNRYTTHLPTVYLIGQEESGPLRWFIHDSAYLKRTAESLKLNPVIVEALLYIFSNNHCLWHEFQKLVNEHEDTARLEISVTQANEIATAIVKHFSVNHQKGV